MVLGHAGGNWARATLPSSRGGGWRSVADTGMDPGIRRAQTQTLSPRWPAARTITPKARWSGWKPTRSSARAPAGQKEHRRFRPRTFFRDARWTIGASVSTFEFRPMSRIRSMRVYPYDWAGLPAQQDPGWTPPASPPRSRGSRRGGYRLAWKEEPNPFDKAADERSKVQEPVAVPFDRGLTLDQATGAITAHPVGQSRPSTRGWSMARKDGGSERPITYERGRS